MGTQVERRSSVMEYEQSVLFGQYHERLATFARMQSQKPKIPHRRSRLQEMTPKGFRVRLVRLLTYFGNWPLLFFLGIAVAFASFLVDVSHHALVECKY